MLLALTPDSLVPSISCSLLPISSAKWASLNENSETILICRVQIVKSLKFWKMKLELFGYVMHNSYESMEHYKKMDSYCAVNMFIYLIYILPFVLQVKVACILQGSPVLFPPQQQSMIQGGLGWCHCSKVTQEASRFEDRLESGSCS